MELNWNLRNPFTRAILDIATRINGVIVRRINQLKNRNRLIVVNK